MLCCDATEVSLADTTGVARQLREVVLNRIAAAINTVLTRLPADCVGVLTCGEGEYLFPTLAEHVPALRSAETLSLAAALGPLHSSAACAVALARLARTAGLGA